MESCALRRFFFAWICCLLLATWNSFGIYCLLKPCVLSWLQMLQEGTPSSFKSVLNKAARYGDPASVPFYDHELDMYLPLGSGAKYFFRINNAGTSKHQCWIASPTTPTTTLRTSLTENPGNVVAWLAMGYLNRDADKFNSHQKAKCTSIHSSNEMSGPEPLRQKWIDVFQGSLIRNQFVSSFLTQNMRWHSTTVAETASPRQLSLIQSCIEPEALDR